MGLADDALVAVLSNMGAPLVGQERLADPDFATKPLRAMEDYLGRKFDAVMSLEIGGGNVCASAHGGGDDRLSRRRRGHDGPRLPRSADDQRRGGRPAMLSVGPRRYPRQ